MVRLFYSFFKINLVNSNIVLPLGLTVGIAEVKLNKLFTSRAMNVKPLFWQTHC